MPRFSSLKTFEQTKRSRQLSERSHLGIEFPQSDGRVFRTYIPFLQNPIITERGQSNLVEYDLVGRPGGLYSYGGSKSRVITLQFKINLVHLMYSASTEGISAKFFRSFNLFYADKERAKKAFNLKPGGSRDQEITAAQSATDAAFDLMSSPNPDGFQAVNPDGSPYTAVDAVALEEGLQEDLQSDLTDISKDGSHEITIGKGFPHASTHRAFYREALSVLTGNQFPTEAPFLDGIANYFIDGINSANFLNLVGDAKAPTILSPQDQLNRLNDLIDAVYVWVNLVRSTTLNNSTNTVQGPPIVRLNHGPMYNNIPCIVSDYSIDMNQQAGYEVETLTPKELVINMTLKETRTTGQFQESEIELGDHVAGWEAIISNNNTDPYNGSVSRNQESISITELNKSRGST
jgi:hypothetical protein|tara:strand:- start:1495 stop:2709 length:1215 start_codon:yes stop_codon:yes gene_type:complete